MATTSAKTYRNYIGGEWVDAAGGETFETKNPANGDVLGIFPLSGTEDMERAIEAAKAAYVDWRLVPAPKRGELLFRVARTFEERKDELTEQMVREMGKVRAEAAGDVQEAIDMTYYMAGEGRRMFGHTTPSELPDKFMMSTRNPVGVVGAITPWNFPIAIPSWKIAPAIVCGNTVVFKPAGDTPLLAELFVEIFEEAGLPPGVLNIVHGEGKTVGEHLVQHPDVPLISFTGSREVGAQVQTNAGPFLKNVHLELGGKNAIIVMDDADVDLALDGILWSAFGTSGQRCTAASRVIAGNKVYDELAERLAERASAMTLGDGLADTTDVGPVINRAALDKIHSYTEIGKGEGAELLTGGEIATENGLDKGFFYRPTVFSEVDPGMRIAQEEIFGPSVSLIRASDVDEAIRISNGVALRAVVLDLHARREQGVPGDPRPEDRDHVHQRRHDRRRGASPVRRREGHRQRPSRGGPGGARLLHRVEVGLRGLLRQAPARADRRNA